MTRAIFFDLDSCLAAADEVGRQLFEPAFEAVRAANDGSVTDEALAAAFEDCWRIAFDVVAKEHGFPEAMRRAGFEAFRRIEVTTRMRGYPDLHLLPTLGARLFLVTSGFRRLQESKVRALGFAGWFVEVVVDAIDGEHRGKEAIFRRLLNDLDLRPQDVLVVGDNPDSELVAARRLGLTTVQILRPGVTRGAAAHHITGLAELVPLLAAAR